MERWFPTTVVQRCAYDDVDAVFPRERHQRSKPLVVRRKSQPRGYVELIAGQRQFGKYKHGHGVRARRAASP
jgi:hypothetical protein